MSELHPVSRLVVLYTFAMLLAGCAHDKGSTPDNPVSSPCNRVLNPQAPIVCVDDTGDALDVDPFHVLVHDSMAKDRKSGVTIQWFTKSGTGDLQLEIDEGCVGSVTCNGNGHCSTKSLPGAAAYGEVKQCKYDVWIVGAPQPRLDPTIIITGCC